MDEQTLRKILKEELRGFATKDDVANVVTKDDAASFATKDDLANFATKDDIKGLKEEIKHSGKVVTKDLTKLMNEFVQVISDKKADRDQVLSHEVRLNSLERKVFPQ